MARGPHFNLTGLRLLVPILAGSLALKLLVFWSAAGDPIRFLANDSPGYVEPASALVERGVFAVSPDHPDIPETLRTPGYPVFIAVVRSVAGAAPQAVVLAQILLSLGTLALTYALATELGGIPGHVAALLLALDLASFSFAIKLLSETLFTFLLTATLLAALRFQSSAPRLSWCAAFGLLLAVSILVRPIAYYLMVPLALWVAFVSVRRSASARQSFGAVLVFLLPCVVGVGGWQLRNYLRTGVPTLSRITGINMLFFRGAAVVALRDGISFEEARSRLGYGRYSDIHPETVRLSPEALSERWRREGLALIKAHPLLFVRTQVRPLGALLLGTPEHSLMALLGLPVPRTGPLGDLLALDLDGYLERWILGRPWSWLSFVVLESYLLMIYFSGGVSWIRLLRRRELTSGHLLLGLVFLYLLVMSAGPEAYSRFRVPLTPILCVWAAAGFEARGSVAHSLDDDSHG